MSDVTQRKGCRLGDGSRGRGEALIPNAADLDTGESACPGNGAGGVTEDGSKGEVRFRGDFYAGAGPGVCGGPPLSAPP